MNVFPLLHACMQPLVEEEKTDGNMADSIGEIGVRGQQDTLRTDEPLENGE